MNKKTVIVYSTKKCSKCRSLKRWLRRNKIAFEEKDLDNTDVMTDLVMRNLFVLSAPALETKNRFWMSTEIFDENNRLTSNFKDFLRGERT